jgi:hypothetical protein
MSWTLPSARVERHHQHPLADQALDGHAVQLVALANHHHLQVLARVLRRRAVEQLAGGDQADMPASCQKCWRPSICTMSSGHIAHALDMRQREGIGLAAHFTTRLRTTDRVSGTWWKQQPCPATWVSSIEPRSCGPCAAPHPGRPRARTLR